MMKIIHIKAKLYRLLSSDSIACLYTFIFSTVYNYYFSLSTATTKKNRPRIRRRFYHYYHIRYYEFLFPF